MRRKDIISRLLRFEEFANFYHNEWVPKNILTDLKIDPSCAMYGAAVFDKNKRPCIVLRQLTESPNDIFLLAHEMCHVIKHVEKQSIEFGKAPTLMAQAYKEEEIFDMGNKLGSMLDDPLINSLLQDKYSFNPAHFYTSVFIPDTSRSLDSYGDPLYEWHIFKKALLYSQFALQLDSIKDTNALIEWDKLKEKYIIRRPNVSRIGEELYLMTNNYGYNDIKKNNDDY